jgi:hypothetical protein
LLLDALVAMRRRTLLNVINGLIDQTWHSGGNRRRRGNPYREIRSVCLFAAPFG